MAYLRPSVGIVPDVGHQTHHVPVTVAVFFIFLLLDWYILIIHLDILLIIVVG